MRAALLLIFLASSVTACSILSVHLTEFKDPNDSDLQGSRMSLTGCLSTLDAEPNSCNIASANIVTLGTNFPVLLMVVDTLETTPLKFLFTVSDNETQLEYYSMSNVTLHDLVDPLFINFRFRAAHHFTGNFRFRLFADANCREESTVYISTVLNNVDCDAFCYITVSLLGGVVILAVFSTVCCCFCCVFCRKREKKSLSHPYDICPSYSNMKSGTSSFWTYRNKPSISSPLEASPSSIEQDMSTFVPLPATPCTPV